MKSQQSMSSSTLPLTILTLAFLSFSICVNAQSCSHEFAELAQEKNISGCKRLRTLDADFGWNWNYHNDTNSSTIHIEILFGVKLNAPQGWIAWGVNPGKRAEMIGTKALIAIKQSDGTLKVDTYNITKETRSGCRLLPSHNIGLRVSNMSVNNMGSILYIYARLILPSEEYNITRLNHVWQVGYELVEDQPLNHPTSLDNVDSTETIDLTTSDGRSTKQNRSFLRSVHGVLNIIGWGTLLPIGVIIARYFRVFPVKWDPTWFYLHIGCQLTGFLIGTVGWAIGLSLGHASTYYTFHTHRAFGIIIFTFSTIQMLAFRLKPKETDDYRKYWNMYHHFLGYGLLAIIFLNIFKGISILKGGKGWRWTYIGILAFLGAIVFTLEIFTWVRFFVLKPKQSKPKKDNPK
ncbi:cytochrome b561 and DOMON domain-containing protein At3g25290-like [Gastrolobium bilobum]|uniref:cytochrome b561 and DOMON domain-containing protein At3g25290-like n=1 Tax=Gastrolobium bilobum TaxID=150636 RepID=UPI002AB0C55A|nr:cytochrome b561 and DOMON domain-containing protein At3g25290-like [Gastrolobium bilobum]